MALEPDTADAGPSLSKLRRQFRDYQNSKSQERKESRQARHYYHGDHWTEDELKVLRKRKQPAITFNRVARKVDGVVGLIERIRQDPKAFPRTPQHEEGAELATAVLRYALDQARWQDKESEVIRDAAIEGVGVAELVLEAGDMGDPEVSLDVVDGETFFYDPRSFREDFSDARYMGVAKWMHLDDAKEMFPDRAEEMDGLINTGGDLAALEHSDREQIWSNVEKKHLFIVEHWFKQGGEWSFCFYTADVTLASGQSPFKDEKGKSFCKYLAFGAYVDHDGDRYGFVRNLKSAQDEINMRRSKALHQLNTRRIIATKGVVDDVERTRIEAARPDGYIELGHNAGINARFEFDDVAKQAELAGQLNMLEEAKNEIEGFGPNPALIGQDTSAKSGRAIALLQQAGMAELGPFMKAYRGWKLRIYRAVWNAVQSSWTGERWVRVTDDENVAQFIQVNGFQIDETGRPTMINALGALDVDIILDESPDSVNTMQDVFELLESLAAAGVPVPPAVVIEMSSLPTSMKKRITDMLQQAQQADPMAEQAKHVALEQEQSVTAKNKAGAMRDMAHAMETMGKAFNPQVEQPQAF